MLVLGDGSERIWALACVLFFGLGGASYLVLPAFTRRGRGIERREIEHRGIRQPAVVFKQSRGKLRVAVLGCMALTASGALLVLVGERLIGWITAAFFGALSGIGLPRAIGGPMYVALLPDGILHRTVGEAFVPWDAISEVAVIEMDGAKFVGIRADAASIEMSTALALGIVAGRAIAGVEMSFSGLVATEEELCHAIEHLLGDPAARERIGDPDASAPVHAGGRPPCAQHGSS